MEGAENEALTARWRKLCDRCRALAQSWKAWPWAWISACCTTGRKKLFHIGYDVERQQFSPPITTFWPPESRRTSLFAIANRPGAARALVLLGRPVVMDGEGIALRSWAGQCLSI